MPEPTLQTIIDELRAVRAEQAAVRPLIDGIPILANAIDVLQRDVRTLRDDARVTGAMFQRLDHTMRDVLDELAAIRQLMIGMNDRLRKLEDAQPPVGA